MRVNTIEVGGNLFDVLDVKPQIGAGFPDKGPMFATNELICVISDRLWRTRFVVRPITYPKIAAASAKHLRRQSGKAHTLPVIWRAAAFLAKPGKQGYGPDG